MRLAQLDKLPHVVQSSNVYYIGILLCLHSLYLPLLNYIFGLTNKMKCTKDETKRTLFVAHMHAVKVKYGT